MNEYNAAFFGLFENVFKLMKKEDGEDKALSCFRKLMTMGLSKSYGTSFSKGDVDAFVKLVSERDVVVGLHVKFPKVSNTEIVYQFHDDPFPNLKGMVDYKKLDDCYLSFKVNHLLGDGWKYETTKHIWDGDAYSEHRIYKV